MSFFEDIATLLGPISMCISIGTVVYAWWTARPRANAESIRANQSAITDVDDRVDALENRIAVTEEQVKHLPDKHDLNVLHDRITGVYGVVQHMSGAVEQIGTQVRRINDHLMDKG